MINKVKELQGEGKSIRNIARTLNIGRDKVFRMLKEIESDKSDNSNNTKIGQIETNNRTDDATSPLDVAYNRTDEEFIKNLKKVDITFDTEYDTFSLHELKEKGIIPSNYVKWTPKRTKEQDLKENIVLLDWFYNHLGIRKIFKWDTP